MCVVDLNEDVKLYTVLRMVCDRFYSVTLDCRIVRQHRTSLQKKGTYKRQNKFFPQNSPLSYE